MANREMNKEITFISVGVLKIPYKSTFQLFPPRRKILRQFLGTQNLLAVKMDQIVATLMVRAQSSQQRLGVQSRHLE